MVRFLKKYKNCFFFKNRWIFRRKTWFFFKITKGGNFVVECASNDILSRKSIFHFSCKFFWAKNQKLFNIGKIRKYDEESVYFEKKTLSFF